MVDSFSVREAQNAFERAYRRGRRDTNVLSRLRRRDNRVPILADVLDAVPRRGERYRGVQDIRVDRIVGTESRGDDYARAFQPRKRTLAHRWIAVFRLMAETEFSEPITVLEVGGVYFVRDGNHRVSVARALERTFLSAEVTSYDVPVSLPPDCDRNDIPLLRRKVQFHQATGVFTVVSDAEFSVACPRTWDYLEREILEFNRSWFVRRFGREPVDREEQVRIWYDSLYRNTIDFIRRNSLTYLFPGMRETDVFVEMLRLWNSHDDPDSLWLGEIYDRFVARRQRRRLLRTIPQTIRSAVEALVASPEDEYRRFVAISRVDTLVPDFEPLPREKGFYRFLYRELVHRVAPRMKPDLGRAPYLHELTPRWHAAFYRPVAARATRFRKAAQRTAFYRAVSRRFLVAVIDGTVSVDDALQRVSGGDT